MVSVILEVLPITTVILPMRLGGKLQDVLADTDGPRMGLDWDHRALSPELLEMGGAPLLPLSPSRSCPGEGRVEASCRHPGMRKDFLKGDTCAPPFRVSGHRNDGPQETGFVPGILC